MATMYSESLRAFLRPVLAFLDDPGVSEIMINGPQEVWIERGAKLERTNAQFTADGLLAAARNMAQFVGRPLNDERPRLDARLPDGSRIHVVLPPVSRKGVCIAIRKFFPTKMMVADLVRFGTLSDAMAKFIEACVRAHKNMVVAGGTSSGKTTLLNILSQYIPDEERILTIEDSAELQLNQEHLVPFEARPPDEKGRGAITIRDLLHSSLRLRPDRIVIGEVRGEEAFDLVQAMNTGHSGSMCTTHANSPTETLRRLESLCVMSTAELPLVAVRAQLAAAVHVILSCERLGDGTRRITHVAEVLPLTAAGDYQTKDVFQFRIRGKSQDGKILGEFMATGHVPAFADAMVALGLLPDLSLFAASEPAPAAAKPQSSPRNAAIAAGAAGAPPPGSYAAPAAGAATGRPTGSPSLSPSRSDNPAITIPRSPTSTSSPEVRAARISQPGVAPVPGPGGAVAAKPGGTKEVAAVRTSNPGMAPIAGRPAVADTGPTTVPAISSAVPAAAKAAVPGAPVQPRTGVLAQAQPGVAPAPTASRTGPSSPGAAQVPKARVQAREVDRASVPAAPVPMRDQDRVQTSRYEAGVAKKEPRKEDIFAEIDSMDVDELPELGEADRVMISRMVQLTDEGFAAAEGRANKPRVMPSKPALSDDEILAEVEAELKGKPAAARTAPKGGKAASRDDDVLDVIDDLTPLDD